MRMARAWTRKRRRMAVVVSGLLMLVVATGLTLYALDDGLAYFYGPTELVRDHVPAGRMIRLGGLVADGSVEKDADGVTTHFVVTDLSQEIRVRYKGILPDLFREGQGVVARGRLDAGGRFVAEEVLARHDETYIPAEVKESLERAGTWKGPESVGAGARPAAAPDS